MTEKKFTAQDIESTKKFIVNELVASDPVKQLFYNMATALEATRAEVAELIESRSALMRISESALAAMTKERDELAAKDGTTWRDVADDAEQSAMMAHVERDAALARAELAEREELRLYAQLQVNVDRAEVAERALRAERGDSDRSPHVLVHRTLFAEWQARATAAEARVKVLESNDCDQCHAEQSVTASCCKCGAFQ